MIYLEMNHVRKSFGDLEVLKKDISLKVEEGRGTLDHRPVGIGKIDAAAVCGDAGDDGWR